MDKEEWNRRYRQSELVWTVEPNQFVVAETGSLRPGAALDLGSGEGRNALWLAGQGWRVTAVDYADVGIEKGRQLAGARGVAVAWVVADLTEYAPAPGAYDLVLLCYIQVPAAERHAVMAAARDAVRPGGTLLYIAHDLSNLEHGAGGPRDPAVLCTPADIVADLPGFEILKAGVVQRAVKPGSHHGGAAGDLALDTLVRAVRSVG